MAQSEIIARLTAALDAGGGASSDFDLNPNVVLPENRVLRPGGVLVGISAETGTLVLTKRAMHLKHHPGQVAFPGGKMDPTDADVTDTALREAQEEIALPRAHVEVIGILPNHETVTAFQVTPVVGLIHGAPQLAPERGEVDEIFHVPLAHVTNPANFRIESRLWRGQRRYYFTVPWGPYYIWGATARILRGLADRMTQ